MKIYDLMQIKNIFAPHYDEKLSVGLSYKIYKLCNVIEQEESFFNKKRQELIEEFGARDADGQLIIGDDSIVKIIPEKQTEAQLAMDELTGLDAEMPSVTFTLAELSEIKLSVRDMRMIELLLVEE